LTRTGMTRSRWRCGGQGRREERQRDRVEASKRIIMGLAVGRKVMFRGRRHTHEAEMTKIGRSKVTIALPDQDR
jgi:hypothetical protein